MKIALFLIGYGNVAQRFVQLLDESKQYLDGLGIEPAIAAVITRRHGRAVNLPAGATHEIVGKDRDGSPILKRKRFSIT